ncbi:MAG: hypothetical protein JXA03_11935 [Bacteroidales bacterium]|nr:hypothetical protein [Bacteroidales bacterium]
MPGFLGSRCYPGGYGYKPDDNRQQWLYIYKSNDYGESWYQVFQPTIISGNVLCFESGFDSIVFAGAAVDNGIIRSADYGETWSVVHAFTYEELVYDITISPGGVIWAGTDNIYGTTGAYRSYDMGLTWEYTGPEVQVYSIEFNALDEMFAGTNIYGLYKYIGTGWDNVVPGHSVRKVLTAPSGDMFLACKWYPYNNGGVMRSQDNGQTFAYENGGLDIWDVDGLALGPANYLYTWDYSPAESKEMSKLFRSKYPVTSTDDLTKSDIGYISFTPNPFRSVARIYVSGFDPGTKLNALIFTMAGSEVWEGEMISGESFQFERNGLKPGIYFLSLKANGTVAGVRKVVVY